MARDRTPEVDPAVAAAGTPLIDSKTKLPIVAPEAALAVAKVNMQEGETVGSFRVDELAKNITIATWPNGRKFCVSYA